jgi:dihydroneopterin aldolase/2-amino-4-hydroxy-6-hydroxymethyldihydropteridine diphosphokinase/dihydropteroate synthase/2-amino-4-hydroxy-6-hydroxymethyldihydropteridine diphosphokinase/dihydropteroate synthase
LYHPTLHVTAHALLDRLLEQTHPDEGTDAYKVIPIHGQTWRWDHKTFIMGILNTTPDSFSDGGKFNSLDTAFGHASKMLSEGADIVDIGGMSSRPGSEEIPISDELDRTLPFIRKIRETLPKLWISIDTYRSQVAEKAVEAGANLINDISGGELDTNMYSTMAKLNMPVILMHMRGSMSLTLSLKDRN